MAGASAPSAAVDAVLAALPAGQRKALQAVRRAVHAAAPGCAELVNYGIPMVRLDGKNLVGFGAGKGHCAFYVMSTRVPKGFPELERYDFSTSTLRFQPDDPPPASLLKRLVKARIAENKAIAEGRAADPHATRR